MNACTEKPVENTDNDASPAEVERQRMDADIVCVGFGPATAGFLTTLSKQLVNPDGTPAVESAVMPGAPPQVLCYERADDIGFGVSGVVTRARGLRAAFPDLDPKQISRWPPRSQRRRSSICSTRSARAAAPGPCARPMPASGPSRGLLPFEHEAVELPWSPAFLHKTGGLVLSMGQFMQWVGAQVQSTRHGADLARHAGVRGAHRGPQSHRRPPARPGRG